MEWFETVKGTLKKTAEIAYDKSSQLVEITKLNIRIAEAESNIDKSFKELGIKYFEEIKNGCEVDESIKAVYENIENKYSQIEELKNKINLLKKVKACENCGEANPQDNIFCAKCGAKIED